MPKPFLRLVSAFLSFCLFADPSLSAALSRQQSIDGQTDNLSFRFVFQALAGRVRGMRQVIDSGENMNRHGLHTLFENTQFHSDLGDIFSENSAALGKDLKEAHFVAMQSPLSHTQPTPWKLDQNPGPHWWKIGKEEYIVSDPLIWMFVFSGSYWQEIINKTGWLSMDENSRDINALPGAIRELAEEHRSEKLSNPYTIKVQPDRVDSFVFAWESAIRALNPEINFDRRFFLDLAPMIKNGVIWIPRRHAERSNDSLLLEFLIHERHERLWTTEFDTANLLSELFERLLQLGKQIPIDVHTQTPLMKLTPTPNNLTEWFHAAMSHHGIYTEARANEFWIRMAEVDSTQKAATVHTYYVVFFLETLRKSLNNAGERYILPAIEIVRDQRNRCLEPAEKNLLAIKRWLTKLSKEKGITVLSMTTILVAWFEILSIAINLHELGHFLNPLIAMGQEVIRHIHVIMAASLVLLPVALGLVIGRGNTARSRSNLEAA